jgi:hypothetical protein
MKLKNEIIQTLIQIMTISGLLFLLLNVYKTRSYSISENIFIKDLTKNWNSGGISSIISIAKNENCPNNYKSLFTEEIDIEFKGCDCRESYYYGLSNDIFIGTCTYVQLMVGCKNIVHEDDSGFKKVNTWKNVNLCVSYSEVSFYDVKTSVKNKCPINYKQCGVDSNNFGLCFPQQVDCPINNIIFSTKDNLNDIEYNHKVKLSEDWYIYYSNKLTNNSLYVDIKYSEGRICINPKEKNLKENFLHYKHNNNYNFYNSYFKLKNTCLSKIGKISFDERYTQLDSTSKFKFYFENKILEKIEHLPNYKAQEMINSHSYLYSRSYIYWSPHCNTSNNLDKQSIIREIINLTVFDGFFDFLVFFTCFLLAFFVIFIPIGKVFKLNYNYLINSFFFILILVFLIVTCFISLLIYNKLNIVSKISNLKCGEYITNHSFNRAGEHMNKLLFCSLKMILSLLILLILSIVNLILIMK